jgi:hypothetical protein
MSFHFPVGACHNYGGESTTYLEHGRFKLKKDVSFSVWRYCRDAGDRQSAIASKKKS